MNNKELDSLKDRIAKLEKKVDKFQNIEDRLEVCFKNVEKFRNKMIQNGYSYEMLQEFNSAIQPIVQHYNEIRNMRERIRKANEAIADAERREKETLRARQETLIKHVVLTAAAPEFPYNTKCRNFSFTDGEALCEIKMDLQYCGSNCPYATNQVCSNKVDGKGMTVVYKKRRVL